MIRSRKYKNPTILFGILLLIIGFVLGTVSFSIFSDKYPQILVSEKSNNQPIESEGEEKPSDEEIIEENLKVEQVRVVSEENSNNRVKLLFVGDVMPGRAVGRVILENDRNPLEHIEETFSKYDYVIVNLEAPVATGVGSPAPGKAYTFNAPVEVLPVLRDGGIDMVSLANNHAKDYGSEALITTFKNLEDHGIDYFGAGANLDKALEPKYRVVKGNKIAFLGFNDIETVYTKAGDSEPGVATINKEKIKRSFDKVDENTDLIVVMPHWGTEHALKHNARQAEYGKYFIDKGADIVIGGHSHTIQDVGEYKGKKIYYSLGNFLFSGFAHRPNAQKAIMLEVVIENGEIVETSVIKVELDYSGFPHLVD